MCIVERVIHSESVVMQLTEKRLGYGHVLYVDNFYTGVQLAKAMLAEKTLRRNRKHLPEAVVSAKPQPGSVRLTSEWADRCIEVEG